MRYLLMGIFGWVCSVHVMATEYSATVLVEGLNAPWAMASLPSGGWLVTERSGQLLYIKDNTIQGRVAGTPEVYFAGQGGLLDVSLHPAFENNGLIYLSYSQGNADSNALAVFKARLNLSGLTLEDGQTIFSVSPGKDTPVHYGGRIAFMADGSLLLSSGDGFDYRESAQRKDAQLGKILRMDDSGRALPDNPWFAEAKYLWTLGHRNPQALLFDAVSNSVFSHEHGPAGGDEINIIKAGVNYGWPVVTNGKDYSGASISPFTTYPGMQSPWLDWTPSIAPSDMILYRGQQFTEFQGQLLVTTLKSRELRLVEMSDGQFTAQKRFLSHLNERLRGIEQDAAGNIFLLTDSGKLLQLTID
ncbi:PQQ-dependent sugar dehydrogenase [Planctobacterium marinum]|uniref:PQQ-dependent sugar dehydrogenase n=1 Tax=Planctobacterium marinum TaxID=1631968 RepID=UPI001E2CEFB7|nr:PQQ-dependent sugar dehydrogenase [Planctobacterium marinum]MCC2604988.1 PQQ-dependent sugar dehydrogenase [Planctobacterium marinum]